MTADFMPPADFAIVCPRADLAAALATRLEDARAENRAPFRAWRGRRSGVAIFCLVCGPGPAAATSAALALRTLCPAAPLLWVGHAAACDPALRRGDLLAVERAVAFRKEELYLLHATPAPLAALPAAVADADLARPARAVPARLGSAEARIDFATQREWLWRHYGFQAIEDQAFAVGEAARRTGGRWAGFAIIAGPAGEPPATGAPFDDGPALDALLAALVP